MAPLQDPIDRVVTSLVPSLSRSLAEQFNVFRVMRHGTHEKQLSNVFAWLLEIDGTHELGDVFQRLFLARVNATMSDGTGFPTSGYRVAQEVDTSGDAATGKDIADIVLTSVSSSVVIENFGTSDGHGHDYYGYLAHGALGGRDSVVVLLCIRHERELQANGWEQAVVLTYADLLKDLHAHIDGDEKWRRKHPQQNFFITELVEHFVEGPEVVSTDDRIAFISAMCETGESVRYSYRPQDAAAQEFAELVAQHAKRQFEDARRTLSDVKTALRRYAEHSLRTQINERLQQEVVRSVQARFVGQWEWYVRLLRDEGPQFVGLVFGPTAAVYNDTVRYPVERPDFSKVFVLVKSNSADAGDQLVQTEVGLDEVLAGLGSDDTRLADSVLTAVQSGSAR
jgi:hypothetical protein